MDDILLVGIVLLGASVQWLTGMGFALVAVPALVLLLGPAEGVVLANCASGVICLVGLAEGWRRVRVGAMVPLCVAAGCTVPVGVWLTRRLPEPVLLSVMGVLVTLAVLLVMGGARVRALRGAGGAVAAGALGGVMNSAAGVGGPPMSLYAVNAGWSVREFVPNAFFYGVVVNVFSVVAHGVPGLGTARWVHVALALAVGMVIGRGLARRLSERRARWLVLGLALVGGVTTLVKGVWGMWES
ncbi:sulfite exporter TauE/SafE family protein [Streptomyces olivaceus]|uniref:sulfite exporter TauE/SafE family protein n=1 Tax=Streptomyces olivaceus TaxID=47716 RepID=UPI001CCEDF54|nr:sulfite exporter TauE/SafE family protein [Streptomyces olivaceus]MBZ6255174.1 sulfite exporter TauE/SafE family protein [Streptomyces olivaceus]